MRRREFLGTLGSAAAWPLAARAQQPAMPVIGFLSPGSREVDTSRLDALRLGLADINYLEGQNLAIEYRGAQHQFDRLPALAADLVSRQVGVIVVVSTQGALAAKAATNTIPIVFSMGADPVQLSLVTSLNRPGGNITGVYVLNTAVMGKRLELLREAVPATRAIGYLANPKSAVTGPEAKELREAARALGVELRVLNAASEIEIGISAPVRHDTARSQNALIARREYDRTRPRPQIPIHRWGRAVRRGRSRSSPRPGDRMRSRTGG